MRLDFGVFPVLLRPPLASLPTRSVARIAFPPVARALLSRIVARENVRTPIAPLAFARPVARFASSDERRPDMRQIL